MAEPTHSEKAVTTGTETITMRMVFHSERRKVGSWTISM